MFAGKKILITGGLGFIGSNLATRLVGAGAQVTLVDSLIPEYGGNLFNIDTIRHRLQVNISDVRDEHSLQQLIRGKDFLFNLAGQTSHIDSMERPFPDLEINARAQLSILETCRRYNPDIEIVFAGTRQVYGKPQYLPVDESHPIAPVDVNGVNKMAGERYHQLYYSTYGIRSVILRLTNTYGPRMRVADARQTFLGIWIRRIIEGMPFQIYGDGEQLRDFNYVEDVIDAMLRAALCERANGEVYNLGCTEVTSLASLAAQLVEIFGNGQYEFVDFPAERKRIDIDDYYSDFQKATADLDWKPATSLDTGLRKTLDYYKRFGAQYYW